MELYYSFSALIVVSSIFAYINARFFKLPTAIGITVIALLVSLGLLATDTLFPNIFGRVTSLISSIDFTEILMGAMLNFLIFAGAIHVHLEDLREQRIPVIIFSTISVVISTIVIGFAMVLYPANRWFENPAYPMPFVRGTHFALRPDCRPGNIEHRRACPNPWKQNLLGNHCSTMV